MATERDSKGRHNRPLSAVNENDFRSVPWGKVFGLKG